MRLLPSRIAPRLYMASGMLLATVVALAAGALLHVSRTDNVVTKIREAIAVSALTSAQASTLLERHMRIIESAPAQVDRAVLSRNQAASHQIISQILGILDVNPQFGGTTIYAEVQELEKAADVVIGHAMDFAQDEALKSVADYAYIAGKIQDVFGRYRKNVVDQADREVRRLLAEGSRLKNIISVASVLALLVIGPLSYLLLHRVVARLMAITQAMRAIASDGTQVPVPSLADRDEIGDMARALQVFKHNAVALMERSQQIETLNARFDLALQNMARGLSMFDAEARLIVCNRQYLEMYGLAEDLSRPGTPLLQLAEGCRSLTETGEVAGDGEALQRWFDHLRSAIRLGKPFSETHKIASGRTIVVHVRPLADGGWVDIHEDVTEKIMSDARINELATLDALTGLANRHRFTELLTEALVGQDEGQYELAVLWIDLDKFKVVNDTLGHPAGDALLKAVAGRLRATVRAHDVVSRLGGDEFAILIRAPKLDETALINLSNRIIKALTRTFEIEGHTVQIGGSVGVVVAPRHGRTPEDLLKNADIALYRAKSSGRGTAIFFEEAFEQEISERRRIEDDLRVAVSEGQLTLFYQPIVDLKQRRVAACESLMRWRHPDRGLIPPGLFIPIAEDVGLIGIMGRWAIEQACRDAAAWPEHIKVAVNLSADQFSGTDLVAVVRDAVAAAGIDASRLELEVTETLFLNNSESTRATLNALRELGVGIALDDFGTGYASLSYLRQFPFTKLKIDQSFVRDLPSRMDCVAIVRAVVELARSLEMETVAEGIETAEHLAQVIAAQCDLGQGYYFSRPVPVDQLAAAFEGCIKIEQERAA